MTTEGRIKTQKETKTNDSSLNLYTVHFNQINIQESISQSSQYAKKKPLVVCLLCYNVRSQNLEPKLSLYTIINPQGTKLNERTVCGGCCIQ